MTVPVFVKAALLVGAVGELATLAAAQASESNVVLLIAAMSSFVAFVGVLVTGFVTWSGQREARVERAAQTTEAREAKTEVIKAVEVGNKVIGDVALTVDSVCAEIKAESKALRAANTTALATIADMNKRYELLVAEVARSGAVAAPVPAAPIPVVIEDTKKPVPVDVIVRQEPQ